MRPPLVDAALARASRLGFPWSCEAPTGQLLAVLASGVPIGGRVLEVGTGCGVGTAWIQSGLAARSDVDVVTVEHDAEMAAAVAADLPGVRVVTGDAALLLPELGTFDLVFADAEAGKWTDLHLSLDAVAPGGALLVDDMDLGRYDNVAHRRSVTAVRDALLAHPDLVSVELAVGTGLILSTRRR